MTGIVDLGWFVVCGLMLNLTPGPDFAYITAWSLRQGVRAGVVAALGICTGCLAHVLAATFGLSALLAASANAMSIVKWLGAIYLVWLGALMMIGSRREAAETAGKTTLDTAGRTAVGAEGGSGGAPLAHLEVPAQRSAVVPLRRIFVQGMLTNILNPKVALFFLAFLPQFVDPAAANKMVPFLLLGLIFTFNGLICCVGFAWLTGGLMAGARHAADSGRAKARASAGLWLTRVMGAVMAMFGVRLAMWSGAA